ncbi:EF-hand domain-containing protein [Pseudanabaena sp. 'Roaring Creek']|uniref:EF-hand domain-containing protein n=1 Tax=Pseudanabaena sp. 'Roaring Creek' TaxID=1681830 RepID=UPI0006D8476F|nr:EF-hand domain-containing protein [Pseudanabaena sp. 'Roaring Creek']
MLSELQKRKLTKLFSMYDAQNLGILKLSDFERLAQRLAELRDWKPDTLPYEDITSKFLLLWNRMRAEIKKKTSNPVAKQGSFEVIDAHARNQIDLEEWFTYYDIVLHDESYRSEILAFSSSLFSVIDTDGSGNLDRNEWVNFFRVYNIPVVYASETFKKIDRDDDGVLSMEEVLSTMHDFYFSNDPHIPANYMFGPI